MTSPQIGFAVNEILCLVTLATGVAWLAGRRHVPQLGPTATAMATATGAEAAKKPFWAAFGAEIFLVVALMFTCRVAVADWPKVPSGSMEPTLRVGDFLLVDHLAYGPRLPFTNTAIEFGRPQRGDVVVFRYPPDVSQFYVKRLIGVGGDVVRFQDGVVSVDGAPIDARVESDGTGSGSSAGVVPEDRGQWLVRETAAGHSRIVKVNPFVQGRAGADGMAGHCSTPRPGAWSCTVPPGAYLVLGDNRDNSADSRVWGFLPHAEVYGKAVRVLFNPSDSSRTWLPL